MASPPFFSRQRILPALLAYLIAATVSCVAFSVLLSPQGRNLDVRSALGSLSDGVAFSVLIWPYFVLLALPGFMLARLILELLRARTLLAFVIGGAASSLFYFAPSRLFSVITGSVSIRSTFGGLSELLPLVVAGAVGGAVYFLVRFGPKGPPETIVEANK